MSKSRLLLLTALAAALGGCQSGSLSTSRNAGAEYTILLATFSGPESVAQAQAQQQQIQQSTGWKDVAVVTAEQSARVVRGRFGSIKAAQADLQQIKSVVGPDGRPVFLHAIVVPLPTESVGPPELNLDNANGTYTLLVAVFYDVPDAVPPYIGRKQFAVQYAQQLRQEGEQAFYEHGPIRSAVTVGLFGPEAVQKYQENGQTLARVVEPTVMALQKKYPILAVNGRAEMVSAIDAKTGQRKSVPSKTELIPVPKGAENQPAADANDTDRLPQPR